MSVKAAGEMLGLSSWQVKQRCDSGALKARFDGRQRLVEVDSIRAYFESLPTERPAS